MLGFLGLTLAGALTLGGVILYWMAGVVLPVRTATERWSALHRLWQSVWGRLPEKQVAEQRVSTWQTRWAGNANLVRAYGEAQRLAYQELGRAEAQAELLMSIVHALEDMEKQGDSRQHLRKIVLARIAGLLDAMRAQVALPEGEKE